MVCAAGRGCEQAAVPPCTEVLSCQLGTVWLMLDWLPVHLHHLWPRRPDQSAASLQEAAVSQRSQATLML